MAPRSSPSKKGLDYGKMIEGTGSQASAEGGANGTARSRPSSAADSFQTAETDSDASDAPPELESEGEDESAKPKKRTKAAAPSKRAPPKTAPAKPATPPPATAPAAAPAAAADWDYEIPELMDEDSTGRARAAVEDDSAPGLVDFPSDDEPAPAAAAPAPPAAVKSAAPAPAPIAPASKVADEASLADEDGGDEPPPLADGAPPSQPAGWNAPPNFLCPCVCVLCTAR
jgi:hypothetical protein